MKKFIIIGLLFALLGAGTFIGRKIWLQKHLEGPDAPKSVLLEDVLEDKRSVDDLPKTQDPLPTTLNIEVPFFSQAPHGNWDYPWQEACEEASALSVANVYKNMYLDIDSFNTELLRLVDWEISYFGAYEHTTVAQTVEMLKLQYGLESEVHVDPTFEDIQEILNKGHLIIAPFAGKLLENPNFRNGGPVYHMLVIKGYDQEKMQIVTNDVGTRNGADYVYDWETIENALHDWDDTDILIGKPTIIEILPPE